jgi:hypothetical protein
LGFGGGFSGIAPFRPVTGVFLRSKTGLLGLVPAHPLDVRGKAPINMAKGVFPVAGGAVSQQAMEGLGASTGQKQNWKVMKAPPRESLTNTAVVASAAPARVSRTFVAGGSSARVVTLDRNSSTAYDAHTGAYQGQGRADAKTNANVRVPAANVRTPAANVRGAAPPPRAITPPPAARASTATRGSASGAGGGWNEGGSSRGSTATSAPRSSPSAGASHPSSSGGRPR